MIQITNPKRFFVVLVVVAAAGYLVFRTVWGGSYIQKNGELEIASGQGAAGVWAAAVEEEYTSKTLPWKYYSWREQAASQLKAGTYTLEKGEHVREIIRRMVAGDTVPDQLTITYPEGFTLDQIAERTAARGIGTKEEFLAVAKPSLYVEDFPFLNDLPPGRTLEGYLFPDTYRFFAKNTPEDVIRRMLSEFNAKITDELRQNMVASGRSLDEVVIMASMIEREVIRDEDMALVSGVLWKRIDDGAGLYVDATTRYYLNKWDGALTVQDLAIDSPYNTRKYRDLPPGPISNPGLRAIIAAARPQESEYYYYLSAPSGETIFSRTNDEHNRNKAKYLR